jgi:hypothetical protein
VALIRIIHSIQAIIESALLCDLAPWWDEIVIGLAKKRLAIADTFKFIAILATYSADGRQLSSN